VRRKIADDEAKFVKFDREDFAQVIAALIKKGYEKPETMTDNSNVIRSEPLTESQLLEPMPVMYPASPSPLLAAQPHHSSAMMPFLDLNSYGNPYLPPDNPKTSAADIVKTPASPAKPSAAAIVAAAEREAASKAAEKKKADAQKKAAPKKSPKYAQKDKKEGGRDRKKGGDKKDSRRRGDKRGGDKGKPKYAQKPNKGASSSRDKGEKKAEAAQDTVVAPQQEVQPPPSVPAGKLSYAEMARRKAAAEKAAAAKKAGAEKKEAKKEDKKEKAAAPAPAPKVTEKAKGDGEKASTEKKEEKISFAKMVAAGK